jgi:hypothetical protein
MNFIKCNDHQNGYSSLNGFSLQKKEIIILMVIRIVGSILKPKINSDTVTQHIYQKENYTWHEKV